MRPQLQPLMLFAVIIVHVSLYVHGAGTTYKEKNETVEYEYLGNAPPTEARIIEAPLDLPWKDTEVVQSQYTVTFVTSNNNGLGVAQQIDGDVDGGVEPPKRFRRNSDTVYTEDHVFYVRPTPRVQDDQKKITIYVEHDRHGPVDGKTLFEALKRLNETGALGEMTDETVTDIYQESSEDFAPTKPTKSFWHTHTVLVTTIITLAVICITLIIISLIYLRCQRTGGHRKVDSE